MTEMKNTLALLFYLFLFSTLFVLFYSLISQESRFEIITSRDFKINFEVDHQIDSAVQLKSDGDSRSPNVFLGR